MAILQINIEAQKSKYAPSQSSRAEMHTQGGFQSFKLKFPKQ